MTDKIFDDFIKNKIKDHASPVPADMWDRIEREKNKKKGGFWWSSIIAVSFLICSAVIVGWFYNGKEVNTKEVAALNKTRVTDNISGTNAEPKSSNSSEEKVSNKIDDNSAGNNSNIAIVNDNENQEGDIKQGGSLSNKKAGNSYLDEESLSDNRTTFNDLAIGKTNGIRRFKSNNRPVKTLLTTDPLNSIAANTSSFGEASYFRFENPYSLLAFEEKNNLSSVSSLQNLKYTPFCVVDCPSNRLPGNNSLYVEFFGSPDFATKKMEYKGTTNAAYLRKKDSTESSRLSFTVGVCLTKALGNHLMFKTGLQYSQINEKFSYRNESERNRTTVVTVRTIISSAGDTIMVRDTSTFEQIGYRSKNTYNKYRSFDVPLIFGYEFGGETWRASVNTGVIMNLSSWQEGEFLDTTLSPTGFAKGKEAIFKRKIGLGFYGGLSLIKKIGDRTDFFAEPYLRYNLSNLTTDASPFRQKFHVAGILLGVRYKLTGRQASK